MNWLLQEAAPCTTVVETPNPRAVHYTTQTLRHKRCCFGGCFIVHGRCLGHSLSTLGRGLEMACLALLPRRADTSLIVRLRS